MLFKDKFLVRFISKKFVKNKLKNKSNSRMEPDWNKIIRNDMEYLFKNNFNFSNNQNYILGLEKDKILSNMQNFLIVSLEIEIINYYISSILHLISRLFVSLLIFAFIFMGILMVIGLLLELFWIHFKFFEYLGIKWNLLIFIIWTIFTFVIFLFNFYKNRYEEKIEELTEGSIYKWFFYSLSTQVDFYLWEGIISAISLILLMKFCLSSSKLCLVLWIFYILFLSIYLIRWFLIVPFLFVIFVYNKLFFKDKYYVYEIYGLIYNWKRWFYVKRNFNFLSSK